MKVLHILRNNKLGGTQVLANTLNCEHFFENEFFFIDNYDSYNYLKGVKYYENADNLIDIIESRKYSLIISYVGFYILRKVSPFSSIPIFISCGSKLNFSLKYYIYSFYSLFFSNLKIIATSQTVFNSIKKFKFRNIYLIPNPLRESFFDVDFRNRKTIRRFTMVGRMDINDSARNWGLFCDLSNSFSDFEFYAVGDGNRKNELELNYKNINFTGNLDVNQLINILVKSDIYLQLNNDTEGFGIAMYEAMALGCIPVAPNILINKEIISNGNNGFLYNDNIYDTINNILSLSKDEISVVSQNAYASVKKYNNSNYINSIKKLLY